MVVLWLWPCPFGFHCAECLDKSVLVQSGFEEGIFGVGWQCWDAFVPEGLRLGGDGVEALGVDEGLEEVALPTLEGFGLVGDVFVAHEALLEQLPVDDVDHPLSGVTEHGAACLPAPQHLLLAQHTPPLIIPQMPTPAIRLPKLPTNDIVELGGDVPDVIDLVVVPKGLFFGSPAESELVVWGQELQEGDVQLAGRELLGGAPQLQVGLGGKQD